ncbi:hypothetical protein JCGZ_08186 [Jatropha curcas]|uniref:JHL20J20.12 protein n=1 Tax=Jatropha curcas TaxID=180498 RepID=E6NTZ5_JATCU|nr:uncharacterized protein JHL20J20.12 [Jatropha curcas]KDP36895.1 hypothetical protein JCGZ_08186 [Jatropha curcas]BAJ53105.1 JHL20J20.12 [Jatropha curcas]
MSRCFPYPPLGYLRNGARGEAVSESIKIQSEWGKARTEHDKRKKEKKERKKEKKERKKSRKENKEDTYIADRCNQQDKRLPSKVQEEEAERSGLTEEHDQPVCSQSLCYSPDSTRSSDKRKRDDLSYNITKSSGNIIRIRLPLQKHREVDASTSGEHVRSSSRKSDFLAQKQIITVPDKEQPSSINSKTGINISDPIVTPCANLEADKDSVRKRVITASGVSSRVRGVQNAESLYKDLLEDWVPLPLGCDQNNIGDQEWLFGTKKQEKHKRLKSQCDEPCHGSSTLWPCARYLPEAEVYALPYTVPF